MKKRDMKVHGAKMYRMSRNQLYQLFCEARTALAKYSGVVGVGIGYKERQGLATRETAFRVYVREKKPARLVASEQRIPLSWGGMPTDVIAASSATSMSSACEDKNKYSTLIGGITVGSQRTPGLIGTLGFLATVNGETGPNNIVLVSNAHVLNNGMLPENQVVGDVVYQPDLTSSNNTLNNPVGKIIKSPAKGDFNAGGTFYVDAAAARLDISISSCCSCNCGVSFANEIRGLNVNSSNAIVDVGVAKQGDIVYKVGRETGRTVGKVVSVNYTKSAGGAGSITNAIEVAPLGPNCNGEMKFSGEGDSGSALINDQGKLVGLHFSHSDTLANGLSCHIAAVIAALNVTPITLAHPVHNNPAAVGMSANLATLLDGSPTQAPALRLKFLSLPEGRALDAIVEEHRREVIDLVNNDRRVAVVWQRNKGPAFLNRALNNARDPRELIPDQIEGVTRRGLLAAMGDVLAERGSPALRGAIQSHRSAVLDLADSCRNLHELVDRLTVQINEGQMA